jgi:signal transduction histidine kinase
MSMTDRTAAGPPTIAALPLLEVTQLLGALQAVRDGDFSVRLPGSWTGVDGKIADTFNEIVAANARMASQLERVGTVVGKQGNTRQRVTFSGSGGAWGEMERSVNTLIDDLLWPDKTRLVQVLANLLHNAAKFTDPGGRIALRVRRDGSHAVIVVSDTGVGIPPETLPTVFDLFTRCHIEPDRSQGGLGIGLALVRRLTEMHGGP